MLTPMLHSVLDLVASLPPHTGFLAIIIATFILEDLAIVGTGLLASTDVVDPVMGGSALVVGIVLGDLGLFGLGSGAAKLPGLRQYVDTRAARRVKSLGNRRSFFVVLSTRFVPGLRLPTYTALGYVGASFWHFFYAVMVAVTLWTLALYCAVVFLGHNILASTGPWKWCLMGLAIILLLGLERRLGRSKKLPLAS